ncbi:pyroglutamyl-peptidase I family protein [Lignipirellula cremea]|uniref:Pyrrolidone-carboxylate peptidase n=1 Tax=Lignipirellula cremea TaxID=2528010 RepID=A0A518DN44_9BACT|nr:pyroglutamyl-peptidase I [Lignipirellula cremea]QDU93258.1 Pyrrolidone-carboxylate peptidase [Lignipirellula cremea]
MSKVLLTAFGEYGEWAQNASWLAVVALTRNLPDDLQLTTRLYPVDFDLALPQLTQELAKNYDYVLHVGQSPGSSRIQLEAIGLNIAGRVEQQPHEFQPLAEGGPVAYQSALPLGDYTLKIREQGIPVEVSHHAGVYLCNAFLYWTHHQAAVQQLQTQATFVHLPLATSQVVGMRREYPSLPSETAAQALLILLQELAGPAKLA